MQSRMSSLSLSFKRPIFVATISIGRNVKRDIFLKLRLIGMLFCW